MSSTPSPHPSSRPICPYMVDVWWMIWGRGRHSSPFSLVLILSICVFSFPIFPQSLLSVSVVSSSPHSPVIFFFSHLKSNLHFRAPGSSPIQSSPDKVIAGVFLYNWRPFCGFTAQETLANFNQTARPLITCTHAHVHTRTWYWEGRRSGEKK